MLKSGRLIVPVAVFALLGWVTSVLLIVFITGSNGQHGPIGVRSEPSIEAIREISRLAVLEVALSDVVFAPEDDPEIAYVARGDAVLALDLDRVRILSTDSDAGVLHIQLPQPQVTRARIDHEKSGAFFEKGPSPLKRLLGDLFDKPDSAIRDAAMSIAQRNIAELAEREEHVQRARLQAENLLGGWLKQLGWRANFSWIEDEPVP